jgi:hypothetical protein
MPIRGPDPTPIDRLGGALIHRRPTKGGQDGWQSVPWLSGLPNFWPLLPRSNGEPWRPSAHCRPFAKAVIGSGLDPAEVTIYALRHSSIVRQLLGGVPIRVVATTHDTSVAMIERTYSRYITDHSDVLSRAAMLDPAAYWR